MTDGDTGAPLWSGGEDIAYPVSLEEAVAYYEAQRWRQVRPSALQAGLALAEEVKRLWSVNAHQLEAELSRYRAAIPEIIGCAHHEGLACRRDNYGWHGCCLARLRAAQLGITAEPGRVEMEDGA